MMLRCTVLSLLLSHTAIATAECECLWGGSFTKVQVGADIVVAGTVVSSKGNSVDLVVDQLLRGREYSPEIRVWMNPGTLCRPEAKEFPVDSQWVMALHRINESHPGDFNPNTPNISAGRTGDFSLSICGGYWLSRKDKLVTGNLVGATRWERNPDMSPVLLSLVTAFTAGEINEETLREASTIDPALQELQIETRLHLRQENRRSGMLPVE